MDDNPTLRFDDRLTKTPPPDQIILSTDAAIKVARIGCGYITTAGHYGLRIFHYDQKIYGPDRTTVAELLAICEPLTLLRETRRSYDGISVRTDSADAITWIDRWKNGSTRLPKQYNRIDSKGRPRRLTILSRVFANNPHIEVIHQRAHIGESLNEAADSLAKMAVRYKPTQFSKTDLRRTATRWAASRLHDHTAVQKGDQKPRNG